MAREGSGAQISFWAAGTLRTLAALFLGEAAPGRWRGRYCACLGPSPVRALFWSSSKFQGSRHKVVGTIRKNAPNQESLPNPSQGLDA